MKKLVYGVLDWGGTLAVMMPVYALIPKRPDEWQPSLTLTLACLAFGLAALALVMRRNARREATSSRS